MYEILFVVKSAQIVYMRQIYNPSRHPTTACHTVIVDYDLVRLGPTRFSYLVRDILREELGIRVEPMQSGEYQRIDGTFSKRIAWPAGQSQEIWQGSTLIRTFFYSPKSGWAFNSEMMLASIDKILGEAAKNQQSPNYLFCISNVPLSETPSLTEFGKRLMTAKQRHARLKGVKIWDYFVLRKILNERALLRKSYSGFIAPDKVLANLSEFIGYPDPAFEELITRQLAMDAIADQWVRLNQAGVANHEKLALSSVAVDLPIAENHDAGAVAHIIDLADQVLKPSRLPKKATPHLVLVGGPGQGKTTIGQLVCQVHRTALLSGQWRLPNEVTRIISSVQHSLSRIGLRQPACWRWPIRVELAAFADVAIGPGEIGLLRYITDLVSMRVSESMDTSKMRFWMRSWPWLIVLDGLDEVPSQLARDIIMQRISEFMVEAAQSDCDLLVMATTRPQGYTGEFSKETHKHITLTPLTPSQAAGYAQTLANVQHSSDPDLLQKIIRRMQIASEEESTARLMRSPLQVTIMSLLLETRERAPQARFSLFEAYYDTIYAREVAKPGPTGQILERLRSHIKALHDRVGLVLQVQEENTGEADAALSKDELHNLAVQRLEAEGFDSAEAHRLAAEVIRIVTQRLVLIVPKAIDDVGFEVRSIQEFMAARALVSGRDAIVIPRLALVAASAHWRNTWLFAAGRIFTEREHLRRDLISMLEDKDIENMIMMLIAPGADLALDLLDDDLAITTPVQQRALTRHALTLLRRPPDDDLQRRAGVLYRYANADQVIRAEVDQAIDHAMDGSYSERLAASQLLRVWQREIGSLGLRSRQILGRKNPDSSNTRRQSDRADKSGPQRITEIVSAVLDEAKLNNSDRLLAEKMLADVSAGRMNPNQLNRDSTDNRMVDLLDKYLSHRLVVEATSEIALELAAEPDKEPAELAIKLRTLLRIWLQRQPFGERLVALSTYPDVEGDARSADAAKPDK
jgi:hypothetical protein